MKGAGRRGRHFGPVHHVACHTPAVQMQPPVATPLPPAHLLLLPPTQVSPRYPTSAPACPPPAAPRDAPDLRRAPPPTRSVGRWPSPSAAVQGCGRAVQGHRCEYHAMHDSPSRRQDGGSAARLPPTRHPSPCLRVAREEVKQDALCCVEGHVILAAQPLVGHHLHRVGRGGERSRIGGGSAADTRRRRRQVKAASLNASGARMSRSQAQGDERTPGRASSENHGAACRAPAAGRPPHRPGPSRCLPRRWAPYRALGRASTAVYTQKLGWWRVLR